MNSPDEKVLVERQSPYQYTQDGLELKERADQTLIPLFAEFMDRGYSPYQICAVVHDSVAETGSADAHPSCLSATRRSPALARKPSASTRTAGFRAEKPLSL